VKELKPITTLFLDIGGVLLTDGGPHIARNHAATKFKRDSDAVFYKRRGPKESRTE
jgi:hypothetical protein